MKTNSQNQTKQALKDPSVLPYYTDIMGVEDSHFTKPSMLKSFAVNKKVYNAVVTINPVPPTYADCMEVVDWFIDSKMRPKAKAE